MFKAICTYDQIAPQFLNFVLGLGRKTKSFDENYMSCYHLFSDDEKSGITRSKRQNQDYLDDARENRINSYGQCILCLLCFTILKICTEEICYNIRHVELHGRDLKDPWSFRQSAIHQKFYFDDGRTNWILVQPPKLVSTILEDFELIKTSHPMSLHIQFLSASMINWRTYLNYLTDELTGLVIHLSPFKSWPSDRLLTAIQNEKVSFPILFKQFDLTFSLSQQIHVIRKKLFHVRCILENTRETLMSIQFHAQKVSRINKSPLLQMELFHLQSKNISNELHSHLSTTCKLLRFSKDINLMVLSFPFENEMIGSTQRTYSYQCLDK